MTTLASDPPKGTQQDGATSTATFEVSTVLSAVGTESPPTIVVVPAAASPRVATPNSLDLHVMGDMAGIFTHELLKRYVRKEAVYQAYIPRKENGAKAR